MEERKQIFSGVQVCVYVLGFFNLYCRTHSASVIPSVHHSPFLGNLPLDFIITALDIPPLFALLYARLKS